jgi:dienelactone hydrolase
VGSGPHPAILEGDAGVPGHTIYRPGNLSAFSQENPLPVVAWGNGGCANSSQMHANFLAEIASHGFLVVAIGPFNPSGGVAKQGPTKSAQLLEALDWATAENMRRDGKYYQKINPSRFAAMGMSCGGLQALEVSPDPRVTTSVIMNCGVLNAPVGAPKEGAPKGGGPKVGMMLAMPAVTKDILRRLHAPVFYVIGGEKDIAYPNALDDFARIDAVPVAMANLDVGHGGTYSQPNGGEFGRVAVAWLKWELKEDTAAGKVFSGPSCGLCRDAQWKFEQKRLP